MRLTYDSKYEVGDTVYTIVSWLSKTPNIQERIVEKIEGVDHNTVVYRLNETRHQILNSAHREDRLYATREEALKEAIERKKDFDTRKRERLEKELREAELGKRNAIAEASADADETINSIKRDLEELNGK